MNTEQLKPCIAKLGHPRLLVLGDLMVDQYLWGAVERVSPEAPVQVVEIQRETSALGGAGNVAHNLAMLGAQVYMSGVVGEDPMAELIRAEFKRLGINTDGLFSDPSRPTSQKTRVFAINQQMLRLDREQRQDIDSIWENRLLDYLGQVIDRLDGIVISDYAKGVLTPNVLSRFINLGRKKNIPVIIDPKGEDYHKYAGATLLTPNVKEASQATHTHLDTNEKLLQAGERLRRDLNLESLLITRSKEGMTLFQQGVSPVHIPARAKEVYDVSGAGDTVIAAMAMGITSGLSSVQSAFLANLAAGIVVGKLGVATVSREELRFCLEEQECHSHHKIKSVEELKDIIQGYRNQGQRAVFTFGCFDVLTIGLIRTLQKSRSLGQALIVGLPGNGSASVTSALLSAEERAHIVCALDCVNFVVIYDEDTPEDLIHQIQPHTVVKVNNLPHSMLDWNKIKDFGGNVEELE